MKKLLASAFGLLLWVGAALAQPTPPAGVVIGAPVIGTCSSGNNIFNNAGKVGCQANPSVPTSANPSATIGLSAVNGSAATFMTSDSAPALSQTIAPTWTGLHTFSPTAAASPTALAWSAQSVATGTTDTAGANWTFNASRGTGTGIGGNIIFQGAPHSTTGSTQNALVPILTINGDTRQVLLNHDGSAEGTPALLVQSATTGGDAGIVLEATGNHNARMATKVNGGFAGYIGYTTAGDYGLFDSAGTFQVGAGTSGVKIQRSTVLLTGPAAATLQHGAADAASPVAQTLQFQNSTGTNAATVNATVVAPLATGTATPGDLIFQTGTAVASGAGQSTKTTALTIKGGTQQVLTAANVKIGSYLEVVSYIAGSPTNLTLYGNVSSSNGIQILSGGNLNSTVVGSFALSAVAASSTAPTLIPNRSDTTTGIGAQASGNISLIAVGAETARVTTTALTMIAGQLVTKGFTVATLPTGITGGRAHVTDQLTTCAAMGVALTGGGAVTCPAFYNGSAWVGG